MDDVAEEAFRAQHGARRETTLAAGPLSPSHRPRTWVRHRARAWRSSRTLDLAPARASAADRRHAHQAGPTPPPATDPTPAPHRRRPPPANSSLRVHRRRRRGFFQAHHPKALRARAADVAKPVRGSAVLATARDGSSADGNAREGFAVAARGFAAAAAASLALLSANPACAELNAREAARGGEFNRGSAQQFGGYDLTNTDVVAKYGADLRLSNFTGAEMRKANLRGANLTGAYLMKAVAFAADFEGANLSDAPWTRAVLNNANFKDAVLTRVVLTSSDLGDAVIEGLTFRRAHRREAATDTVQVRQRNQPETGVSTWSLNSRGAGDQHAVEVRTDDTAKKPEAQFDASRFSMRTDSVGGRENAPSFDETPREEEEEEEEEEENSTRRDAAASLAPEGVNYPHLFYR